MNRSSRCRWLVSIAVVVVSTNVAACSGRNVVFVPRPAEPTGAAAYIAYDRYGDIYPGPSVPVDTSYVRGKQEDQTAVLRLRSWFLHARRNRPDVWTALLRDAGVASIDAAMPDSAAWHQVQEALRQQRLNRVRAIVQRDGGQRRPLVVLVHGFNNDDSGAATWYKPTADSVRNRVRDAAFLEVYWDGLVAPALPFFIWEEAQYNFPLVGLEFRRILNELDPQTVVRIITHSSGGPLVASTLGDASAGLPADDAAYRRYRDRIKGNLAPYRRTFPRDLRVGMIVPAATPITFDNFVADSAAPRRLVFGINPRDYAVSKTVVPCTFKGSTCLGSRLDAFCGPVRAAFQSSGVKLYLFNFADSKVNAHRKAFFWEEHSMLAYLEREDMPRFLDALLLDHPAPSDEAAEFCRGQPTM